MGTAHPAIRCRIGRGTRFNMNLMSRFTFSSVLCLQLLLHGTLHVGELRTALGYEFGSTLNLGGECIDIDLLVAQAR